MTSIGQGRSKSENKMKQEGDDRYREGQIRFKWDDFPSHFGCQARLPEVHQSWHFDPKLYRKWPQMLSESRGERENVREHAEVNKVSLGL